MSYVIPGYWVPGYAVGDAVVVAIAEPKRTLTIGAEDRTLTIGAEDRSLTVNPG